jgi:hypothetical protein
VAFCSLQIVSSYRAKKHLNYGRHRVIILDENFDLTKLFVWKIGVEFISNGIQLRFIALNKRVCLLFNCFSNDI